MTDDKPLLCGSFAAGLPHVSGLGCGARLTWERENIRREWDGGVGDPQVAIRCLECSVVMCVTCAYHHFKLPKK